MQIRPRTPADTARTLVRDPYAAFRFPTAHLEQTAARLRYAYHAPLALALAAAATPDACAQARRAHHQEPTADRVIRRAAQAIQDTLRARRALDTADAALAAERAAARGNRPGAPDAPQTDDARRAAIVAQLRALITDDQDDTPDGGRPVIAPRTPPPSYPPTNTARTPATPTHAVPNVIF